MTSEYKERFGSRIREAREDKGLTQPQLARLLPGSTDASTISRWETGKVLPGTRYQELLAAALDVDVSFFHVQAPQPGTADLMGALADSRDFSEQVLRELAGLRGEMAEMRSELRRAAKQPPPGSPGEDDGSQEAA